MISKPSSYTTSINTEFLPPLAIGRSSLHRMSTATGRTHAVSPQVDHEMLARDGDHARGEWWYASKPGPGGRREGCPADLFQRQREQWPDGQHRYAPSLVSKACRTHRDPTTSLSCNFPAPITVKLLLNYWAIVHCTQNLKRFSLPDYSQSDHTSNKSPGTIQNPISLQEALFFHL